MSLNSAVNAIAAGIQSTSTPHNQNRKKYQRLNLNELTDSYCKEIFRFTLQEIERICAAMELESPLRFNSLKVDRELAMAIILYSYSYPRRAVDMVDFFGISKDNIKRVVNNMSRILYSKFKQGIEFDERQFSRENFERFSKAIYEKGAFLPNIVGFIDGTMQQACRPGKNNLQKAFYNGWKHIHCLKYQAIVTPDGITSSLYGPYIGSNNDQGIFNESEVLERIATHFSQQSPDKDYAIYGDQAYSSSRYIRRPFSVPDELEEEANTSMSQVRVAVEMEFGKISQYFKSCKWKYSNKIEQTKPGLKYILSTIFKNFHTILNGSPVADMFGLDPPELEEYIHGLMRQRNQNNLLE